MELQRFFDHWNLKEHPFQAEEALSDTVYNRKLEAAITHPDFVKIYGDPVNPSTTIVFGEKGSGKTAIRMMIQRRLDDYNRNKDSNRAWVVCYDELNPLLDRLSRHLRTEDAAAVMESIRLADHQDAMLSIAVTDLIDQLLNTDDKANAKQMAKNLRKMSRDKRIDLATLATLYDQPRHGQPVERWKRLHRILRPGSSWDRIIQGLVTGVAAVIGLVGLGGWIFSLDPGWEWIAAMVAGLAGVALVGVSWLRRDSRIARISRQLALEIRVVDRDKNITARRLWDLKPEDLATQPVPSKGEQDSRYELTSRFLRIINELGYTSLVALMDRVDEPVLVNGDAKRMKSLVWPMLNNKFLQQEHVGIKMLLPIELSHMLAAEDPEFKRQARLDKQNVVNPLKWTGTTLYDLCTWRFKNCLKADSDVQLASLFDDDVDNTVLIDALDQMHQPRDAFKFLYAVVLEHCRNTSGEEDYQISRATLDYVRREQSQRVVDLYRGVAAS